jgi:hypothetical protein
MKKKPFLILNMICWKIVLLKSRQGNFQFVIGKIEIIASIITYFSHGSFFCEEEEEERKQISSTAWAF